MSPALALPFFEVSSTVVKHLPERKGVKLLTIFPRNVYFLLTNSKEIPAPLRIADQIPNA
jgi:hypothetical protein